jgi:hypothetical protein
VSEVITLVGLIVPWTAHFLVVGIALLVLMVLDSLLHHWR